MAFSSGFHPPESKDFRKSRPTSRADEAQSVEFGVSPTAPEIRGFTHRDSGFYPPKANFQRENIIYIRRLSTWGESLTLYLTLLNTPTPVDNSQKLAPSRHRPLTSGLSPVDGIRTPRPCPGAVADEREHGRPDGRRASAPGERHPSGGVSSATRPAPKRRFLEVSDWSMVLGDGTRPARRRDQRPRSRNGSGEAAA